jgi:beta-lactam-binding protein with PASTA domain
VTQPPPPPPDDAWPTPDRPTFSSQPETVVGAPPPVGPPPDRRLGAGMLLGLGAVALVAIGIVVAYLLTHRQKDHPVTTTVVTTAPATASAAAKVTVPHLTGLSFADAQAKLDALGLVSTKTEVISDQPAGTVVDQAPAAAAKLAKGSQVTLSVAKGNSTTTSATTTSATTTAATTAATTTTAPPQPQNATMPDVASQNEASAVQALGKVGILASLVFVPAQDPLGTVEQQAKPPGTTVPFHSHVQLNLSKGPNNTADASVPNVVGQTLTQALTSMNAVHLRLIYLKFPVTSKAQAGKIVQQSPLGGGQAPQNAQMLVYLGAYGAG